MQQKIATLTRDQKNDGVIFSSQLMPGGRLHEVKEDDENKNATIERLLNDNFFNNSPYKYNLIRR